MRRFYALGPAAFAAWLLLAACGSSNSTTGGGNNSTPTPSAAVNVGGGSFCDKTKSVIAQVEQLGKAVTPTSPGATPNATAFKQLIGAITSAVDQLDGSAPGEISSAFHTFRTAYDQANTQIQSATTFEQMSGAFDAIDATQVKTAGDQISQYLRTSCGINPSASS